MVDKIDAIVVCAGFAVIALMGIYVATQPVETHPTYYKVLVGKVVDVRINNCARNDYIIVLDNGSLVNVGHGVEKLTIGRLQKITFAYEWLDHLGIYGKAVENVELLDEVERIR